VSGQAFITLPDGTQVLVAHYPDGVWEVCSNDAGLAHHWSPPFTRTEERNRDPEPGTFRVETW